MRQEGTLAPEESSGPTPESFVTWRSPGRSRGRSKKLVPIQQTLFPSPRVKLLFDAILSGSMEFPDPDPELDELEQQGKVVFNRACAQCHGCTLHPSGSTPETVIVRPLARYHNIQTACQRPATDGYLPCPERWRVTLAGIASLSRTERSNSSPLPTRDDCFSRANLRT